MAKSRDEIENDELIIGDWRRERGGSRSFSDAWVYLSYVEIEFCELCQLFVPWSVMMTMKIIIMTLITVACKMN